jgi:Cu+-exporting ATPase
VTEGRPRVVDAEIDDEALCMAAAVEKKSEHPLSRSVVAFAESRGLRIPDASDFQATPGRGVEATVQGRHIKVGSADFSGAVGEGIFITIDGRNAGRLLVNDPVRASSKAAVKELYRMGLDVVLLTGDHAAPAQAIAAAAGIDRVVAGVLPAGKVAEIRRLQSGGRVVAMAGDGINDAPALAQADIGFAMGSGADIAIEAGDVTLLRADLAAIPQAIALSRGTWRVMRQNLFWALAYNVIAIPAAALGYLSPVIASAAMAMSSVSVVLNSLRLKRIRL